MDTKTELLRHEIFQAILDGTYLPGQRLPTEREMAEKSGLSRITVRRALAELEEVGILIRRQGSGTYIAEHAAGHPSDDGQVALLTAVRDPFAMEFVLELERSLTKAGSLLVLKVTEEGQRQEEEAALQLAAKGLRNLVVWPSCRGTASTFSRLRVLGVNMVFFDRVLPGDSADFVGLDNAHATRTLAQAALADGAKELIFISHSGLEADSELQRETTFIEFCTRAKIPHRLERIPWGGNVAGHLRKHSAQWFDSKRQSVLCVNDRVALAVRAVAGEEKRIYGIDGFAEAAAAGIKSVRQPMAEMARQAIELLRSQQQKGEKWKARQVYCRGEF